MIAMRSFDIQIKGFGARTKRMILDKRDPSSHELPGVGCGQRDKSLSNDSQKGKEK
jgi:hypothetical protein